MRTRKCIPAALCLAGTLLCGNAFAQNNPPVAGIATGPIGITVEEAVVVAHGWSTRKHILGKPVYNDKNERIGKVEDVIVNPERTLSYAIISTGGFLGIAAHDVAVPMTQLTISNEHITLPGATRDALRALPEFHYAK
jgi:hypothetical protein